MAIRESRTLTPNVRIRSLTDDRENLIRPAQSPARIKKTNIGRVLADAGEAYQKLADKKPKFADRYEKVSHEMYQKYYNSVDAPVSYSKWFNRSKTQDQLIKFTGISRKDAKRAGQWVYENSRGVNQTNLLNNRIKQDVQKGEITHGKDDKGESFNYPTLNLSKERMAYYKSVLSEEQYNNLIKSSVLNTITRGIKETAANTDYNANPREEFNKLSSVIDSLKTLTKVDGTLGSKSPYKVSFSHSDVVNLKNTLAKARVIQIQRAAQLAQYTDSQDIKNNITNRGRLPKVKDLKTLPATERAKLQDYKDRITRLEKGASMGVTEIYGKDTTDLLEELSKSPVKGASKYHQYLQGKVRDFSHRVYTGVKYSPLNVTNNRPPPQFTAVQGRLASKVAAVVAVNAKITPNNIDELAASTHNSIKKTTNTVWERPETARVLNTLYESFDAPGTKKHYSERSLVHFLAGTIKREEMNKKLSSYAASSDISPERKAKVLKAWEHLGLTPYIPSKPQGKGRSTLDRIKEWGINIFQKNKARQKPKKKEE